MKLFVKGEYVDFEAPVFMSKEKRERFISFMKKTFKEDIKVREVEEKSKEMGEREVNIKKWTADDYSLLLSSETNEELADKMDRTVMGIKMKRGWFVPEFMVWAKKKGYTLKASKKIIQEFLEEQRK